MTQKTIQRPNSVIFTVRMFYRRHENVKTLRIYCRSPYSVKMRFKKKYLQHRLVRKKKRLLMFGADFH